MTQNAPAYQKLCEQLDDLPGVGPSGARRLAEWLIYQSRAEALAEVLAAAAAEPLCAGCNTTHDVAAGCRYCRDSSGGTLTVVANMDDLALLRDAGCRQPVWCLHGELSPSRGIGPSQLNIDAFVSRSREVDSILVATAATVEGRVTADYLIRKSHAPGDTCTLVDLLDRYRKPQT